MHHVLKSHGASIEVMRSLGMGNLGAVCNLEWAAPASDTPEDIAAAARRDAIYNRFFLGGLFKGEYPALALEALEPHLPEGWQDDFRLIQAPLDWIGVNYYTRMRVRAVDGAWPAYAPAEPVLPLTQMGWEIYPQGLRDFLLRTAREYSGDLPIHVTENGMANADLADRPDTERIAYLSDHLAAVREAIAEGAPVAGYYVWSLMDNYEWSLGYEKRFGIVHVDFDTLARTPKASYHALASWWRNAT
jgi:beta-glucosidase